MNIQELYALFTASAGVSTDSRNIKENALYFALKGSNFDGNAFALEAIKKGAICAVVDDPGLKDKSQCYFVQDVLIALQELASFHRSKFKGEVLGITGSNGKTTTKELISSVLESHYKIHVTKGNFNNHIGVPLTLLALNLDADYAIIEMGANHTGEIKMLCEIADPDYGLITNVGKAHLEGFGSLENIKKGKAELYQHVCRKGGITLCKCG